MTANGNDRTEKRNIQASLALALPLAFAAGLAVAGLTLLLALKVGVGDILLEAAGYADPAAAPDTAQRHASVESEQASNDPDRQAELRTRFEQEFAALRDALAEAEAARQELVARVDALESERQQNRARADRESTAELAPVSVDSAIDQAVRDAFDNDTAEAPVSEFESLVAAGVDALTADELQRRVDRFQLDRLELYDQASREGWLDSEEFVERLDTLEEQRVDLRSELGAEGFDRYLFASGRDNRVNVVSVIGGSAAEIAGVQPDDQIVAYAGERVFTLPDLQRATRSGNRGEDVTMELERSGESVLVNVPRGPLGVTLNGKRVSPGNAP